MEQKENKQKTQVAEEQVSCPPQQPVEPHPFISVIPLAVLITLIVMVVKLFPDDALAVHGLRLIHGLITTLWNKITRQVIYLPRQLQRMKLRSVLKINS